MEIVQTGTDTWPWCTSMFGARFAVFVRGARVLLSPCPATRNLSFWRFHRYIIQFSLSKYITVRTVLVLVPIVLIVHFNSTTLPSTQTTCVPTCSLITPFHSPFFVSLMSYNNNNNKTIDNISSDQHTVQPTEQAHPKELEHLLKVAPYTDVIQRYEIYHGYPSPCHRHIVMCDSLDALLL